MARPLHFTQTALTPDDRTDRVRYLCIQTFTNQIKKSKTLTTAQKSALWTIARNGELDAARQEYKNLVVTGAYAEE